MATCEPVAVWSARGLAEDIQGKQSGEEDAEDSSPIADDSDGSNGDDVDKARAKLEEEHEFRELVQRVLGLSVEQQLEIDSWQQEAEQAHAQRDAMMKDLPPLPAEPAPEASFEEWGEYWHQRYLWDAEHWIPQPTPEPDPETGDVNFARYIRFDKYIEEIMPDFDNFPPEMKDLKFAIEVAVYPPYLGRFFKDMLQPDKKARLLIDIDQLNFTDSQMDFFVKLVANRYSPSKGQLKIVCKKYDTMKENVEGVKQMLVQVLEEVRKH